MRLRSSTYDLARLREAIRASKRELAARKNVEENLQLLIPGAKLMSCSGFGDAIIRHMDDWARSEDGTEKIEGVWRERRRRHVGTHGGSLSRASRQR